MARTERTCINTDIVVKVSKSVVRRFGAFFDTFSFVFNATEGFWPNSCVNIVPVAVKRALSPRRKETTGRKQSLRRLFLLFFGGEDALRTEYTFSSPLRHSSRPLLLTWLAPSFPQGSGGSFDPSFRMNGHLVHKRSSKEGCCEVLLVLPQAI